MKSNRRYLVAVALLAALAVTFGVFGTTAPPLAEESGLEPQQGSSSESVGHFQNPPSYDSDWVNITSKAGQYLTLKHNLNTTEVVVDIVGKQSLESEGGAHEWNRTYGGAIDDGALSVIQTSDGGYALAGSTESFGTGDSDFYFLKTDSTGNMQWNKTYGGTDPDYGMSVIQTNDGEFVLAGSTLIANRYDGLLVKTDSNGNMIWNKTYGEPTSADRVNSAVQTSDEGYALAGETSLGEGVNRNFWLIKIDSGGNMVWNKTYNQQDDSQDQALSVIQTDDGGYALAGLTGTANNDVWLVKTDSAGNVVWNKTYGGTGDDFAHSVVQSNDGGYALAGHFDVDPYGAGNWNLWLVKTDSTGNMQWNKTYGGTGTDYASSVIQTGDGGYGLAGLTDSYGVGWADFWLVKTDPAGNIQWNKTYGGLDYEGARSTVQTGDGGYALAGSSYSFGTGEFSDVWLVKVRVETNLEHQRNLGVETGFVCTGLTNNTIILHRSTDDLYWNHVRVRIWFIKEPSWIYGDINMDGKVDAKDLYILGRNYGKTFSLLSLSGIIAVAGIHTVKKRKRSKQSSYIS